MPVLVSTFKQWLRYQKAQWRSSAMAAEVKRRWPSLRITEPVCWGDTDIDAIDFDDGVLIGPFTEIIAQSARKESKVLGGLQIGRWTCIGAFGNIRAVGGKIVIGRDCLIAQNVSLVASNHHVRAGEIYSRSGWDETRTGLTVGDNVWIGCGVTVLPGCQIGNGAVIGAGSVVTKNIPANTLWAGIPARQIRVIA